MLRGESPTARATLSGVASTILAALTLTGCGGDSADDTPDVRTDPAAVLALACTDRINDRTGESASGSGRATLAIIAATMNDRAVTSAESKAAITELRSQRADVEATVKALTPAASKVDGAPVWLESWRGTTGVKDQRIKALESGDQAEVSKVFIETIGEDVADKPPPGGRYELPLRDCGQVFTAVPPTDVDRDFTRAAATTCARVANRRADSGFAADTEGEFAVVRSIVGLGSAAGRTSAGSANRTSAASDKESVKRVLAERNQTVEDLGRLAVPAAHKTEWTTFVASQRALRDRTKLRADALDPPDAATMKGTLGESAYDTTAAKEALKRLGLDNRDCGGLT